MPHVTKPQYVKCPHCHSQVLRAGAAMHAAVCLFNPDVWARTLAAMTSTTPGMGVPVGDYIKRQREMNAPAHSTLRRRWGDDWEVILAAYGLTAPQKAASGRKRKTERAQRRQTAGEREAAAIAAVDEMSDDARRIVAAECDAAHTLKACSVRDLPGVTVNGHKCVAVMLR